MEAPFSFDVENGFEVVLGASSSIAGPCSSSWASTKTRL